MDKHILIGMLRSYCPLPEEVEVQDRMMAFIQKYDECFERSLAIGHITASAWLLNKDRTKVLLMHHAKHDNCMITGSSLVAIVTAILTYWALLLKKRKKNQVL